MNFIYSIIPVRIPRYLYVLFFLLSSQFIQAQFSISGNISNPNGLPLKNVLVHVDDNGPIYTDANGNYQFSVPEGSNLIIHPSSNDDYRNGITTLDQVILSNHLIGSQLLDSPYKIIAADVNSDEQLTTFDIIDIDKLILHLIDEYNGGTPSWRFILEDYVFPDPSNPFSSNYPETFQNTSVTEDLVVDFVGVKMGDLNYSALTDLQISACDSGCGSISGSVLYDLEGDCVVSGAEQQLKNWIIKFDNGTNIFYEITDQNGDYSIDLVPGIYEISTTPINSLWTLCQDSYTETVEIGSILEVNFKAKAEEECHFSQVNLGTSFLRRCFSNSYAVQYCNYGTALAESASISVTLDPLQILESTSVPIASQNGNTITFDLGDLDVDECGQIQIHFLLSCDAEIGQTICATAQISPETNCSNPPTWDGSNLEVTANCQADEVQFEITNTGDAMLSAQDFIVIEDDMIMMMDQSGSLQLNAQESRFVNLPANGSTWRVEVSQVPSHPLSQIVSAAIEGCGENSNGETSQGMILAFPQYTSSPTLDEDCEVVIGSWDPNDKAAKPTGAQEENYIKVNTNIEYTIRFQNTGTDTAFLVSIVDEISEHLDIQSIRPGASSHDYVYRIEEDNKIVFDFPMILLPDSTVNEPASNGFVKFSIAQKEDLPLATIIENNAAIYFDFNEAVITNTVFHTIGEDFLDIVNSVAAPGYEQVQLTIFPQPMDASATLTLDGIELLTADFTLYDLQGRRLRQQHFSGNSLVIHKNELTAGMYVFKIEENGRLISSGKIAIQ